MSSVNESSTAPTDSDGERPRLMLLDTASLYFRAFYGMPSTMLTPDGQPVNAVRGLLDFIARLVTSYRPTHLAACWDNDWRPQWRVDLLPSYKTHRVAEQPVTVETGGIGGAGAPGAESGIAEDSPDGLGVQVPWIVDTLDAAGIPIVGVDGYEADDVIGTLSKVGADAGMDVDVVTGDRDLFQLVDDDAGVRVVYTARGMSNLQEVDNAWIQNKYGIDAAQYADYATMRGDTSDGIPGVRGIGEKSAAQLLGKFGSLTGIIEAASDPSSAVTPANRKKFADAIDYLAVGPQVVAVARELPVETTLDDLALPGGPADPEGYAELTERLGLGSSAARLLAALEHHGGAA